MTLEIAQKLIELRKARGYSQEDLAQRLNISRQAVSKWERAEASPDTDNLIALAKLYGISLDDLLFGGKPGGMMDVPHTSTADRLNPAANAQELPVTLPVSSDPDDVGPTMPESAFDMEAGPTMPAEDPAQPPETAYVTDSDDPLPNGSYFDAKREEEAAERENRRRRFPYPMFAAFAYLLMGFLLGWWHPGWIIFLTVPLYYLPPHQRTLRKLLGNPVTVMIIYLLMGTVLGWWHPGWLIFLLVPVMHFI